MSKRNIVIERAIDEQLSTIPFVRPFVDRRSSTAIITGVVEEIERLENPRRRRRRRGPRVLVATYPAA